MNEDEAIRQYGRLVAKFLVTHVATQLAAARLGNEEHLRMVGDGSKNRRTIIQESVADANALVKESWG